MLIGGPRLDTLGDLIGGVTGFFGQILDSPVVQLGLRAIAIYVVILWLAAAYWAFRDMQLRTANPILPYFAASLVILFTPVFFPFAIVAYRIVRPQEKIGEVYERTLAEEALLAEVEAVKSCPTCARRVNEEWIICPTCRTRLNRVCPNCSRLVGLDWSLCAWCGRDFERSVPGFEAIPAPRGASPVPETFARPAATPSFGRSSGAPALEAPTYRAAGAVAPRDASEMTRDGAHRDLPAVQPQRQAQPQPPQATAPGNLSPAYDQPASGGRALDRAPQPPTLSRPSRAVSAVRAVKGTKPVPSTDPLPER